LIKQINMKFEYVFDTLLRVCRILFFKNL